MVEIEVRRREGYDWGPKYGGRAMGWTIEDGRYRLDWWDSEEIIELEDTGKWDNSRLDVPRRLVPQLITVLQKYLKMEEAE